MKRHNQPATRPARGTGEWAVANVNFQTGCDRDCGYCYAKAMAVRFKRATPESWTDPVVDVTKVRRRFGRRSGRIMFPTTHDISPENLDHSLNVLRGLLESGNNVLIVTKPQLVCIRTLCSRLSNHKSDILFRFTIGSTNDQTLTLWEPGAPSYTERLACLMHARQMGFATSVSLEPLLDTNVDRLIAEVAPVVTDTIWLGRANNLRQIIALNRPGDESIAKAADRLLAEQSDEWIRTIYQRYRSNPKIRFKDSIKKVVGLARPMKKGLDV